MNRTLQITAALVSIVGIGGLVSLAGCAPQQATTATNAAATSVAGAEVALTAAEHVGLTYAAQAPCPTGKVAVTCRDAATLARIKQLDQTAYTAVKQAEAGVVTVQVAMDAIAALSAATPAAPTVVKP